MSGSLASIESHFNMFLRRRVTSVTACPYGNQLPPQHTRTEDLPDNGSRVAVSLRSIPDARTKKRPTKRSATLKRFESSCSACERSICRSGWAFTSIPGSPLRRIAFRKHRMRKTLKRIAASQFPTIRTGGLEVQVQRHFDSASTTDRISDSAERFGGGSVRVDGGVGV